MADLVRFRRDYTMGALAEESLPLEPFPLFSQWLEEAIQAQQLEPNAFALATSDASGRPHVRIVLLKGLEPPYLHFYTNYQSAKGQEIAAQPWVAGCFWWDKLERQVRFEGLAEPLPASLSEAYFQSRPYESQLGAYASPQSQPIPNRAYLEARFKAARTLYPPPGPLPRPPYWGGYRIRVHKIEFWQGRPSRLHDRIVYQNTPNGWHRMRLAP